MTVPESSSRKVPYDLRPRKQVERRMMVHVFQLLAESGFPISTYRYVGFGAFFFVDFILFRRLMGINDMVSLERDRSHEKRVLFNCPFKDINVIFKSFSEYVFDMDRDKPHILWLDYDGIINQEYIADMVTATAKLYPGSIFIVTFDVDFDKVDDIRIKNSVSEKRAEEWLKIFRSESGDYFNPSWKISDFGASDIPQRTYDVAYNAILNGLSMRTDIIYEPVFNFTYADGHEMLTMGGVICSKAEKRKLREIEWEELPFVRRKVHFDPFRIEVPVFTRKERLHLDSHMPCDEGWSPIDFEVSRDAIENYRKIHRYCPLYAELLL